MFDHAGPFAAALVLVMPVVMTWRMRRQAIARCADDLRIVRYQLRRGIGRVVLGTWLLWLTVTFCFPVIEHVFYSPAHLPSPDWARYLSLAVPAVVLAACQGWPLALPNAEPLGQLRVLRSLLAALAKQTAYAWVFSSFATAQRPDGDLLARSWLESPVASLLLMWVGAWSVHYCLGFFFALLPAMFWQFAGRELRQGQLHDRIITLAWQGGIPFNSIMIYPASKLRWVSAFAMTGGRLGITETLLQSLSRREVDAVAAHEMSHLRRRHRAKFLIALLLAQAMLAMLYQLVDFGFPLPYDSTEFLFADLALMMIVAFGFLRRFEFTADADAAALTADTEALITALAKLTRLNGLPFRTQLWDEVVSTHPSTEHRIHALAQRGGVSPERLESLLQYSEPDTDCYSLADAGAAFHEERLFNVTHKRRVQRRITLATLAVLVASPAVIGCGIQLLGWRGWQLWAGFGDAWLATIVLLRVVENALPSFRWHDKLKEQLQTRFQHQDWTLTEENSIFVSLSPSVSLQKFEGVPEWDLGFLNLAGDRACFVGEQAKFALSRDNVRGVELRPGPIGWISAPWVMVKYRNHETQSEAALLLRPGTAASERAMASAAHSLAERLTNWFETPSSTAPDSSVWSSLPPPKFQVARVDEPRVDDPLWDLILVLSLVLTLAAGVSGLLGLTFFLEAGGTAWFVMGVVGLAVLFEQIPSWWRHAPRPETARLSAALKPSPSRTSEAT
jgi:Zn-dependent protease with chaperone function